MQFVTNGPDIPESLLQQHEDGRVVFFCGAGISYPADLPGFGDLVVRIYSALGAEFEGGEKDAFDKKQYDVALGLLERRISRGRLKVRKALAESLVPKLRKKGAKDTHAALLDLAQNREGTTRLVTTNFDRIFEHLIQSRKIPVSSYSAPMLPIPKTSRWNGIAYLHGVLPKNNDEVALSRLVITSGDFGLAYLTERWASRFVSELFRNYVICFVGYSIDDPVMRYMMDALAADRLQGESLLDAYAFGACAPGKEKEKEQEWANKGVIPILFDPEKNYAALHRTLHSWGETWRNGTLGRERIVVENAIAHPTGSTKQDNFVGRMLWALEHKSGLPARRFAEFNPAPSLDWLVAFSDRRYLQSDLRRFEVYAPEKIDSELKFSLVSRPAPYTHAPWMSLSLGVVAGSQWDEVLFQIARWLVRHLNDPKLVLWLVAQGGRPSERLVILIEQELAKIDQMERDGRDSELNEIRLNAPQAIPSSYMKTIWSLVLSDRLKVKSNHRNLYHWRDRMRRVGLTTTLRLELKDLLRPKIEFKKPFYLDDEFSDEAEVGNRKRLVDWELVLATENVHHFLKGEHSIPWGEFLPSLFGDLQNLLMEALDLLRELGAANDREDRSMWHLPSIEQHDQNRGYRDWVSLIELLRDSWCALRLKNVTYASQLAQGWFYQNYPTFKRLAFYAASHGDIDTSVWVNWLLSENAHWLWSAETRRETMRLISTQGSRMDAINRARLESAILAGPPSGYFISDLSEAQLERATDRSIWTLLSKLDPLGKSLGDQASTQLIALTIKYPDFKLHPQQREEFMMWMSGSDDLGHDDGQQIEDIPRKRAKIVAWLRKSTPEHQWFVDDTWREICRTRFFHSLCALKDLADAGAWPAEKWIEALQVWSEEKVLARSLKYGTALLLRMPDDVIRTSINALSWWLQSAAKLATINSSILVLCKRILDLFAEQYEEKIKDNARNDQPVTEAINHPVGHVTQSLLSLLFNGKPNDGDGIPLDIKIVFSDVCNVRNSTYRHGRVLLGARLISLFRIDPQWTALYLLPLFDWNSNREEARAVWEGFLWSPRIYWPLLNSMRSSFLETSKHYVELGDHSGQLAAFLTYAALEHSDAFTTKDFQRAVGELPQEGLQEISQYLAQALEGAGEKRENYWRSRIYPFIHHIWPKSKIVASPNIAASFARLAIAAGDDFPRALEVVEGWLQFIEFPDYVLSLLRESDNPKRFPSESLTLISAIVDGDRWIGKELSECLAAIIEVAPELKKDARYMRLFDISRR